ncbi:MAG: HPr kinase/phosphorylase [Rhizobiaceae bacterium]
MKDPAEQNHHCSVVEIAGTGILIEGKSGTGKTSLALGLLEAGKIRKVSAKLVSDDQAILLAENGNLQASVPGTISGLVELRGYGVRNIEFKPSCRIDLVGQLVVDEQLERMPEPMTTRLLNIDLPVLKLPERHEAQCVRIIFAWLEDNGKLS